jgi:hypothetical protein
MFNAEITWAAFDYREPTGQAFDKGSLKHNEKKFREMLAGADIRMDRIFGPGGQEFEIKWARISKAKLSEALQDLRWERAGDRIEAEIRYLAKRTLPIDSWLFVAPQTKTGRDESVKSWSANGEEFTCVTRARIGSRFGVFSTSIHLDFAKWLVGPASDKFVCGIEQSARNGVLLFYPTWERRDGAAVVRNAPAMGFGILLPESADPQAKRIAWSVKSH